MKLQKILFILLSFQIVKLEKKSKINIQQVEQKPLTNLQKLELQCQQNSKEILTIGNKVVEQQPFTNYGNYQIYELEPSQEDARGTLVYKINVVKKQADQYYQAALQIIEQLQNSGNVRYYFGHFSECYMHKYRNVVQKNWYSFIYISIKVHNTQDIISRKHVFYKQFLAYKFTIKLYYFQKFQEFYEVMTRKGFKNIKLSARYMYNVSEKGFTINLMTLGNFMIATKENPVPEKIDLFNELPSHYTYHDYKKSKLTENQLQANDQFNLAVLFVEVLGVDLKRGFKKNLKCLIQIQNNCTDELIGQLVFKNYKLFLKKNQELFLQKFFKHVLNVFFVQIDDGQFMETLDKLRYNEFFLNYYNISNCSRGHLQTKVNLISHTTNNNRDMKIYTLQDDQQYLDQSYLVFKDLNFRRISYDFFLENDDNVQMIKDQMLSKPQELRLYIAALDREGQRYIADRVINTQGCSVDDYYIYIQIPTLKGSLHSGYLDAFYEENSNTRLAKVNLFHQALSDYVSFVQQMYNMGIKVLNTDPNDVYYTSTIENNLRAYKSKVLFLPQTITEIFKYNKEDTQKREETCKRLFQVQKSAEFQIKIEKSLSKYCSKKKPISKITEYGLAQIAVFNLLEIFDSYNNYIEFTLNFIEGQYKTAGIQKIGDKLKQFLLEPLIENVSLKTLISNLNTLTVQ